MLSEQRKQSVDSEREEKKMTRDDIKKQFPDATDEQITAILNINGTDLENAKRNNVDPKVLKKLQEDSAAYIKLQEAGLTDEEKIQKALADAEATRIDFLKKSNKLDAVQILVAAGLVEDDYKDLIDGFVTDDAEVTKKMATNLATLIGNQKNVAIQKTKESMMDNTQRPGGGGSSEEKTQAEKLVGKLFDKGPSNEGNDILKNYL